MVDEVITSLVRKMPYTRGFWRLHSIVDPRIPNQGVRTARIHGQRCTLNLSEVNQRNIYLGVYDPEESAMVHGVLKPGDLFVDVGANFGYYSMLALGSGARVIAFEPTPQAFNEISKLKIDARQLAIGSAAGNATIWITRSSVGTYNPSFCRYTEEMDPLDVPVETLDNQLASEPEIAVLKLDIEGYELRAIRGATETLKRTRAVFCEFNPRLLEMAGTSNAELYDALRDSGFKDQIGTVPEGACENRLMLRTTH